MDILEVIRAQVSGGASREQTEALIRTLANVNGCVTDVEWALQEMEAVYASRNRRNVAAEVQEYVETSAGFFSSADVDRDLQISGAPDKHCRRTALYKLVKDGVIERHRSKDGMYRRIETDIEIINWENADMRELDIKWPFGLDEWEITFPGTLDVVAGSSGAGKSAFMLNFVRLNQSHHHIRYMTSEMSPQQMKHRLHKFGEPAWSFEPIRCSSNFADKILPGSLNIIDYLEIDGENPSRVVNEIREIFDAIKGGFVLVGLQKKGHQSAYNKMGNKYQVRHELGRGGEFSMEKARLYLSMDYDELSVIKSSNRRDDDAPPLKGRKWSFSLYKGCRFTNVFEVKNDE